MPKQNPRSHSLLTPVVYLIGVLIVLLLVFYVAVSFMDKEETGYTVTSEQEASTRGWKTYNVEKGGFSFKYPKDWLVARQRIEFGEVITIAPKEIVDNDKKIKIFTLSNSYFGIDGLPTKNVTVNGNEGITVDESLYGFMHNGTYITLDAGYSANAKPYFAALVKSFELE